jgi:hypothetical protein
MLMVRLMPKPVLYDIGSILLGLVGYGAGLILFALGLWALHDSILAYTKADHEYSKTEGGKFCTRMILSFTCILVTRSLLGTV